MLDIAVISYNMSVFSAMGNKDEKRASEYSFLTRATVKDTDISGLKITDFFMNSLVHLSETSKRINARVIGIQEFHKPTLPLIQNALNNSNSNFAYHPFSKEIMYGAAVLTIWDKNLLGDIDSVYDEDLGLTKDVEGLLPTDAGRPISIIKTKKGYVLINFHGINRPKYNPDGVETGVDNSEILKTLIPKHVQLAGLDSVDPKKIIIMCDSNDREHKINSEKPLVINGANLHDGHLENDKHATSCCYNWDSCGKPVSGGKVTLGEIGAEKKYKYTGDYVLGVTVKTPVTAEDSLRDRDGASIESDHKLVYAVLSVNPENISWANNAFAKHGGRRKTRRNQRQKRRKSKRQRKPKV